jgi:hypothetical protein
MFPLVDPPVRETLQAVTELSLFVHHWPSGVAHEAGRLPRERITQLR